MAGFYIFLFALLCFSKCDAAVKALKNGSLVFSDVKEIDISSTLTAEFDGKGLEPWYDVAKSFIHTVQKDDLPYDDIQKGKDGDFEVAEFLKGWEMPFLVVFAIGLLFAIIVPIVGFCFCCCRCCGNCGGEMVQKPSGKAGCKRAAFGISLSIITLLMFTGCLMAFVANDRITDTVESYKTTPIRAIRDAEQYFNQTVNVVAGDVIQNVFGVLDIVGTEIENVPGDLADSLKKSLENAVRDPLESVVALANETERMEKLLKDITTKTTNLQVRFSNLTKEIQNVTEELEQICNSPTGCGNISYESALTTGANFSALPDVTSQLTNISDINNKNLSQKAQEGLAEFDNIDETISNKTANNTQQIKTDINDTKTEFTDRIEKDISDKVNSLILDHTDKWVKDIEDAFEDQIEPYDKYRYSAGVGLTCLVLLPVVLMALGLLCGIFGHDKNAEPTDRGAISNMGGNCLMAASGFMFIFVFFLMIFTAICFILGAHLEKGCYSLREETLYSDFIDNPKYWDGKYILAEEIYQNGSIELNIGSILSSCRKNYAIYQAIQGYHKWDLNDEFSVKDKLGDIDENLGDFDVPVDDQEILNQETKDGLENLRDSGVDDIEFDQFFNETRKDVLDNNQVDELQSNLTRTNISKLQTISLRLEDIQREANAMKIISTQLEKDVQMLQEVGGNISIFANDTLNKAEEAEGTYKNQVNGDVKKFVTGFSDKILSYIDQTTIWAVKLVQNDLGRCRILTDVYDAAINLLCRDTTYPFNGFWFSIGFCLFFYIPAIILCVKLAKHYRRMRFEEGFDRHEGLEMSSHIGAERNNKPWLNQGNSVYPK